MTVDVEDYFQVSALSSCIPRSSWSTYSLRVERNIDRVLSFFDDSRIKGTFFTLGWIAERCPQLVRKIVSSGHEIASHGYAHRLVYEQQPREFADDISKAKKILEDTSGVSVKGYRAPSFSIDARSPWAFNIIAESDYIYSSSTYPILHDLYGDPSGVRYPHMRPEGVFEIPITTLEGLGMRLGCGGGGYFRLLPYSIFEAMMRIHDVRNEFPRVFYFHPWEIDYEQPRIDGLSFKSKFRHYVNLRNMESKLRRLISQFEWSRMDSVFPIPENRAMDKVVL